MCSLLHLLLLFLSPQVTQTLTLIPENYYKFQNLSYQDYCWNEWMGCKYFWCVREVYTSTATNFSTASTECNDYYYSWQKSTDQGLIPEEVATDVTLEHHILEGCNRTCSLKGMLGYHLSRYKAMMVYGIYSTQFVGIKDESHPQYSYFWWDGVSKQIAIPLNTVFMFLIFPLNYQNLAVLLQMWQKDVGAAFYFHMFEIIFDFLLSFTIACNSMHGVGMGTTVDRWFRCCPVLMVVSFGYCFLACAELFNVLNQAFLFSMVGDRLRAVMNPIRYDKINQKRFSGLASLFIISFFFLLYLPHIFIRTCYYAEYSWTQMYPIYKNYIRKLFVDYFGYFHSDLLIVFVAGQVICSAIFYFKWKDITKKATRTKEEREKRNKDKEKRDLLIGTVGLNIILSFLTLIATISGKFLPGYKDQWGIKKSGPGVFIEAVLLPLFYYLNGTMAMILHIAFTKSYRRAFWKTGIGKVLAKMGGKAADPERKDSQTSQTAVTDMSRRQSAMQNMLRQKEWDRKNREEALERRKRSIVLEMSEIRPAVPGQIVEAAESSKASVNPRTKWKVLALVIKSFSVKGLSQTQNETVETNQDYKQR